MEILKQSPQHLEFKIEPSKKVAKVVWAILLLIIACIFMAALVFNMQEAIILLLPVCLLIMIMIDLHHIYIITVDKKDDYIKVEKDTKLIYSSNYPLRQVQKIKTTISKERFSGGVTSLMVILEDNNESIIETYKTNNINVNVWQFDVIANRHAEIGRNIAQFLDVPLIEGEYHP